MPNDTESPDHAGLRSVDDQIDIIKSLAAELVASPTATTEMKLTSMMSRFGIDCYSKGRDSQEAELSALRGELGSANAFGDKCTESIEEMGIEVNRLRKDNAELQREVNALAGQVQEMRETVAGLRDENFRLAEARVGR